MVFERSSKEFQGSFKGISRKFKGCPKKVFSMLQGSFKGISKKIKGCLNEVLSGFQGFFKEVEWLLTRQLYSPVYSICVHTAATDTAPNLLHLFLLRTTQIHFLIRNRAEILA